MRGAAKAYAAAGPSPNKLRAIAAVIVLAFFLVVWRLRASGGRNGDGGFTDPDPAELAISLADYSASTLDAAASLSESELRRRRLTRLEKMLTWPSFRMVFSQRPDSMIYQIAREQFYAPAETRIFYDVLRDKCAESPDVWVVDVGANWGYFGLYALSMGCRVLMVEPNPMLVRAIRASIGENPGFAGRAVLVHGVAGKEHGRTMFTILAGRSGYSGVDADDSDGGVPVEISAPVFTLRELLEQNSISAVELLKVDTEGHELDVVAGLGDWDGEIQNMVMEIKIKGSPRKPEKLQMIKKFARDFDISAYEEDYSREGQLACSRLKSEDDFVRYPAKKTLNPLKKADALENPPGEDFWMVRSHRRK
jgi:FkbM family methyltransferase